LAALYHRRRAQATIPALLALEQRRMMRLIDALNARVVSEAELAAVDPRMQSIRNLNRPEDYDQAVVEWRRQQGETIDFG
jgi:molybdopterin-guanine dinucleotide biosynthesis protein A